MISINFVILGDYQIASELGKKVTTTDLSIYDRKTQDTIYTWKVPITFPDKIQSLMQAVYCFLEDHQIIMCLQRESKEQDLWDFNQVLLRQM